jgi:predicted transcriptional regulator
MTDEVTRGDTKVDGRLTQALENDLRLQIMRLSIDRSGPVTPREASRELAAPLSNVAYHFKVLADVKALAPGEPTSAGGAAQCAYLPNPLIFEIPVVKEILTPAPS